jgi:hypothetical protein
MAHLRVAASLTILFSLNACAHATLADRVARGPVSVEAAPSVPDAKIYSPEAEEKAASHTGFQGGGNNLVTLALLPVLLPVAVASSLAASAAAHEDRTSAHEAWLAHPENAGLPPEAEQALLAAVRTDAIGVAVSRALADGAEATAREYGHPVSGGSHAQDERRQGKRDGARLALKLTAVRFRYRPAQAPIDLVATFRAELLGASPKTVELWEVDRKPRRIADWLAHDALLVREALVELARRAGTNAMLRLVVEADDVPRRAASYASPVCGLGPVTAADREPVDPAESPQGDPWRAISIPVALDARDPVLAWEAWEPDPERDPLPPGTEVSYELRIWRTPQQDAGESTDRKPLASWADVMSHLRRRAALRAAEEPPVISIAGLKTPHYSLRDRLAPNETYDWSVRAVATVGGTRFVTCWSYALPVRCATADRVSGWCASPGMCKAYERGGLPYQLRLSSSEGPPGPGRSTD